MNKSSKDLRQVFLRMNKSGISAIEIAKVIGKSRQTVHNWKNTQEDKLLSDPKSSTRVPSIDLVAFEKYIQDNPFAYNRELAVEFNICNKTAHKWKLRLGFKRKKAKTTYKEADEDLKKTL